jgi:hypothetical protein
MAQLTIEIPDALLPEMEQLRSQLPSLMTQWVMASRVVQPEVQQGASQEVLSFLMAQPTPQDILGFKVSSVAQARLKVLLDRNREGELGEEEALELDGYEQLDQLMQMLKIRAYSVLQSIEQPENLLKAGISYEVWSPYDDFGAAAIMMKTLQTKA